jgi:hypothetical protein
MVEAASTSETSVNFYQSIRRNIPEGNHLHTRRRKNLKSHIILGHSVFGHERWATLLGKEQTVLYYA